MFQLEKGQISSRRTMAMNSAHKKSREYTPDIIELEPGAWKVQSQTDPAVYYLVIKTKDFCPFSCQVSTTVH